MPILVRRLHQASHGCVATQTSTAPSPPATTASSTPTSVPASARRCSPCYNCAVQTSWIDEPNFHIPQFDCPPRNHPLSSSNILSEQFMRALSKLSRAAGSVCFETLETRVCLSVFSDLPLSRMTRPL